MEPGKFGDFGARFRYNNFHREDNWWNTAATHNPFYDYFFYSLDIYDMPDGNNLLANFYFRLDVNQISH